MEKLGWWEFLHGLFVVVSDCLTQKFKCAHLPKRLPLQPSPHLTVIVTGATSGIGLETARELAKTGAHVILAVRNTSAGERLVEEWGREQQREGGPSLNAEVMELDLLSLASVRAFAEKWRARGLPLHVLINNAGIFSMGTGQKFSEDGYEHHMHVNHLAPALLSMALLPSLIRGAPSRIVNLNSDLHFLGFANPDDMNLDMNLEKRRFSSLTAYSNSKLAQLVFSRVLQMGLPNHAGVDVILVHPGEVMTRVTRDLPIFVQEAEKITKVIRFSCLEGARSVLYCATDRQVYEYARALREMGCPVAPYFKSHCRPSQVAYLANDVEYAKRVFNVTLALVGLPEDYLDRVFDDKISSDSNGPSLKKSVDDSESSLAIN